MWSATAPSSSAWACVADAAGVQTLRAAVVTAFVAVGGLTGCSPSPTVDLTVGDCLKVGGTLDRPETVLVDCGSPASNFKVAATVEHSDQCPADVDSYYSVRTAFSETGYTVCMDIDWVVGDCMNIDPDTDTDPVRVDCADSSALHRQRAAEIVDDVASVDQCASGVGYAYEERQFTVCVEDVS